MALDDSGPSSSVSRAALQRNIIRAENQSLIPLERSGEIHHPNGMSSLHISNTHSCAYRTHRVDTECLYALNLVSNAH